MIDKISFKNYKIFRNRQTLTLKPITILIGKNNTGKSAIARLPTMIANSLSGDIEEPVSWINKIGNDSDNVIELGSTFEDLVYNRNAINSLELKLFTDSGETLKAYISKDGFSLYELDDKEIDIAKTTFRGLFIDGKKDTNFSLNIDYIGAFRAIPKSNYSLIKGDFKHMKIDGENAYLALVKDSEADNHLVGNVSKWYQDNFEGWRIEVVKVDAKTGTSYQIAISNDGIDAIALANVGQGIHQVLPLIVRSFLPVQEPTLIIIEEPETHLHPSAHGNLATRFVDSFLEDKNKKYLIETHSQNFVLRLRRLIAEGKLKKEDFALYYVDFDKEKNESSLREIEIDETGGIPKNDWPEGIFSEVSKETRAIYNIQLNNRGDVGRD